MNAYQYIADNNPAFAKGICQKYGYGVVGVKSKADLGICLQSLIAQEGEPALMDVMNAHPDKEIILEMFGKHKESYSNADGSGEKGGCGCGCGGSKEKQSPQPANFMNADGGAENQHKNTTTTIISIALLSASLFLAAAIITSNRKA